MNNPLTIVTPRWWEASWVRLLGAAWLAFALTILPLPGFLHWCRPYWGVLLVVYGIARTPQWFGLTGAVLFGILFDNLTGGVLGQHAFLFLLIAFPLLRWRQQFLMFPLFQQTCILAVLSIAYQLGFMWIQAQLGPLHFSGWVILAPLLTAACWPILGNRLQLVSSRRNTMR